MDCFEVIYAGDKGSTFASVSTPPGPSRVAKGYGGGLPQTGAAGWMLNRRPPGLHAQVLLPAYRAAVKLALDQVQSWVISSSLGIVNRYFPNYIIDNHVKT